MAEPQDGTTKQPPPPEVSSPPEVSPQAPVRRRWGRRIAVSVALLIVIVFVAAAMLPTLAGTAPGRGVILGLINGAIDGKVEARSVRLGWLSGQRVEGVNVLGPGGALVVDNFRLDAPDARLLPIVFGSRRTGPVTLTADAVTLQENEQGKLDVPASTAPSKPQAAAQRPDLQLPQGVDTQITVTVGKITYERPNQKPQVIRNFKATAELRGRQKLEITSTGEVEDGTLDAHVLIDNLTDAAGKLQTDKAKIDAAINLTGIPVAPIDALAGQDGQLVTMLGDTLTTTGTASGTLDRFTADINLPALTLAGAEDRPITLTGAVAKVRPGANAGDLTLTIDGQAQTGGVSETVSLTADARDLFGKEGQRQLAVKTRKLPVALVDAAAGMDGKITETLGNTMDLSADITPREEGGWRIAGNITAPNLAGPFNATFAENLIEASTPQPIRLTITPQAYAKWTAAQDADAPADAARPNFAEPATGQINLSSLRLTLLEGTGIDAENSWVSGTIDFPKARIRRGASGDTSGVTSGGAVEFFNVEAMHVEFKGKNLNALDFLTTIEFPAPETAPTSGKGPRSDTPALRARGSGLGEGVSAQNTAPARGKLTSTTTIQNLFDAHGRIAYAQATIHSDTTLKKIPAALPDMLARQQGKLAATTGPIINGSVAVDYKPGAPGTAIADLDATNLKGRLPLSIASGFTQITLTEDANVTYYATEKAAESWIGNLHPLFADAVRSDPENPIRLRLLKDSFQLPLEGGFDIRKAQIAGELNIGKMVMERRGFVAVSIESIAKVIGLRNTGGLGDASDYLATFSPMTFELKDGIAKTSEVWLTTDDMGVGFQGTVDLNNNQIKQMAMAVLGATLYQVPVPAIRRSIKPDEIFELPIEGALDAPKPRTNALAYNATLDILQGSVDEETSQYIELGRTILGGLGQKQSEKKGQARDLSLTWNPAPNARAFIEQYQRPAEPTEPTPQ